VTVAGWKTTVYGYAELNVNWDSTQSFNEGPGNGAVQRQDFTNAEGVITRGSYAGKHPRLMFSPRDSRLGFRVAAPAWGDIKVSGNLELDLGGGAGVGNFGAAPGNVSEAGFFTNPVVRLRHAWGKIETPIVDVLFGQTWGLFGGLPFSTPITAQIPGLTGEIFNRNTQVRVSKTIKTEFVNVDLAVAALRPVQRDSAIPEGQALARISFPKWTGWHSTYINGTGLQPAWLSVSGTVRSFAIGESCTPVAPALTCTAPNTTTYITGTGLAVDAFLPVIPATKEDKSNSLSIIGQFVTGSSINDLYTGLTGGVGGYAYNRTGTAGTEGGTPGTLGGAAAAVSPIDNGFVVYGTDNKPLQPWWITSLVGLEYYIPGGRAAIFFNWGHTQLNNAAAIVKALNANTPSTPATGIRNHSNLYSGGVMFDATSSIRLGLEYARIVDVYEDGAANREAVNNACHLTGFFFF
jgi:hypothetical protein